MTRHYQVITVGESTVDAFMTIHNAKKECRIDEGDLCFEHGKKIDVDRYDFCLGGNATNVAVGLTRLGIKTTLCTEMGDDEFSFIIRNGLAKEHVDRLFVTQTKKAPSNFSVIMNFQNDRTIFVHDVDREHEFELADVTVDYMYLTSMGREWQTPYKKTVEFVKEQKAKLVFNPGSRQMYEGRDTVESALKNSDILFVNKEEAEQLLFKNVPSKSSDANEYLRKLLVELQKMGAKLIIITNGKHGSYALDEKGEFYFRGMYPGQPVERTGAGDAFAAGFLAATIHGFPIQKAMGWGSANAASVVQQIGAQAGLLTQDEIEEKRV